MALPPKVSPAGVDRLAASLLGKMPGACRCGHAKAEHAAASGECMAAGRIYGMRPDGSCGTPVLAACGCRAYTPATAAPRAPEIPGPAQRQGCVARALEGLSLASEALRAAVGLGWSVASAWRASWRERGAFRPQTCTRPAPHRCGASDEPCNGFPRSSG